MKNKIELIKMHPAFLDGSADPYLPATGHEDDAGIDCYALEDILLPPFSLLKPGEPASVCVPLGFGIKMPRRTLLDRLLGKYWHAELTSRSSQNKRGVMVLRGIIDQSYLGEYIVCLVNLNNHEVVYQKGDRICQILFYKERKVHSKDIRVLSVEKRGKGGFGSTGR